MAKKLNKNDETAKLPDVFAMQNKTVSGKAPDTTHAPMPDKVTAPQTGAAASSMVQPPEPTASPSAPAPSGANQHHAADPLQEWLKGVVSATGAGISSNHVNAETIRCMAEAALKSAPMG